MLSVEWNEKQLVGYTFIKPRWDVESKATSRLSGLFQIVAEGGYYWLLH